MIWSHAIRTFERTLCTLNTSFGHSAYNWINSLFPYRCGNHATVKNICHNKFDRMIPAESILVYLCGWIRFIFSISMSLIQPSYSLLRLCAGFSIELINQFPMPKSRELCENLSAGRTNYAAMLPSWQAASNMYCTGAVAEKMTKTDEKWRERLTDVWTMNEWWPPNASE